MSDIMNQNTEDLLQDIELEAGDDTDLFSEELEDRFNAKSGSSFGTASSSGSSWSSLSTFCTAV